MSKKIIFIPADCLNINISRSYFLGKGLSTHCKVYWLKWEDTRNNEWGGGKHSQFDSLIYFWKNITRKIKFIQREENLVEIEVPFLSNAFIRKIFGDVTGRKLSRRFNSKILGKIVSNISPDSIFYADAFYYYSAIKGSTIKQYSDVQDNFDLNDEPSALKDYEFAYGKQNFGLCNKNYAVTQSTADNMVAYFNTPFEFLPNGADMEGIQGIPDSVIKNKRKELNLEHKIIVTYIGGMVWFDPPFVAEVLKYALVNYPQIHFVFLGNLENVLSENASYLGVLPPEESYIYYRLSDIGIMPKNSAGSVFLYDSMPLKIIQYAAARKPIVCFPIKWVEENEFINVHIVKAPDAKEWCEQIIKTHDSRWNNNENQIWDSYDWNSIARTIA